MAFVCLFGVLPGVFGGDVAVTEPTRGVRLPADGAFMILGPERFESECAELNAWYAGDPAPANTAVPDPEAWSFLSAGMPRFECPDDAVNRAWLYRWWAWRRHLRAYDDGDAAGASARRAITEFIKLRPISCPAGHHVYEGRWLRDPSWTWDSLDYWFTPGAEPRRYSAWLADAAWAAYLVTGDRDRVVALLPDLVANYEAWARDRAAGNGLFTQLDDRDGMERSIGGSGMRPTINSYMFGEAVAIARIAALAGDDALARRFRDRAGEIRRRVLDQLWDPDAGFFKTRTADGFVDVREAVGFVPWYFDLPGPGYESAWAQLTDRGGFAGRFGPTTAERRHTRFRALGPADENTPWDGPSWPFATTQTLTGLARVLCDSEQDVVGPGAWIDTFLAYTRSHFSHYADGRQVIWEWVDPDTGRWYVRDIDEERCGKHYNHSTYADLVVTGLVGLRPDASGAIRVHPIARATDWDWFALDGLRYRGHDVTIAWDRTGRRYGRGPGLIIFRDGVELARRPALGPLTSSEPGR